MSKKDKLDEQIEKLGEISYGNLKEQVEALQKALDAGQYSSSPIKQGPVLQVEDLKAIANKYLTAGAQATQAKAQKTLTVKVDGINYRAAYFCVTCKVGNEEAAVKQLANVVNELERDGLIHSTLAPISSLHLARMSFQMHTAAVFTFVHVPESSYNDVKFKYKKFYVEEGGVGEAIEDLTPELAPGEFLAEIRVQTAFTLQEGEQTPKELLDEAISTYLAILPKGTVVREVTQCSVHDLSLPYEIKFYNPKMSDIKKVELQTVRHAARVNMSIAQFNLITGINYYGLNNKRLFEHAY